MAIRSVVPDSPVTPGPVTPGPGTSDPVNPGYVVIDEDDIAAVPYDVPKAMTLMGAAYDGAGVVVDGKGYGSAAVKGVAPAEVGGVGGALTRWSCF